MGKTRRKNPIRRDSGQHIIKSQKDVVKEQHLNELEEEEEVLPSTDEEVGWFFEEDEDSSGEK